MSKPVPQTRFTKAYHRTAVRHRGFNRRRVYLVRPRPFQPATMGVVDQFGPVSYSGVGVFLPKYGWYFLKSFDLTLYTDIKFSTQQWVDFNKIGWFYPSPDNADWSLNGDPFQMYRMTTLPPFTFNETFDFIPK